MEFRRTFGAGKRENYVAIQPKKELARDEVLDMIGSSIRRGSGLTMARQTQSETPPKFEVQPILKLLENQEPKMRALFTKALNLYVSPVSQDLTPKERLEGLRQAVEESLNT